MPPPQKSADSTLGKSHILTFGADLPVTSDARILANSTIKINVKTGSGRLVVGLFGANGADGLNGSVIEEKKKILRVPDESRRGAAGVDGKTRIRVGRPGGAGEGGAECIQNPTNGGPGKQGADGTNGENGSNGGNTGTLAVDVESPIHSLEVDAYMRIGKAGKAAEGCANTASAGPSGPYGNTGIAGNDGTNGSYGAITGNLRVNTIQLPH